MQYNRASAAIAARTSVPVRAVEKVQTSQRPVIFGSAQSETNASARAVELRYIRRPNAPGAISVLPCPHRWGGTR